MKSDQFMAVDLGDPGDLSAGGVPGRVLGEHDSFGAWAVPHRPLELIRYSAGRLPRLSSLFAYGGPGYHGASQSRCAVKTRTKLEDDRTRGNSQFLGTPRTR